MAENNATAIFKALGDESRLAILRILLEDESYVELLASRLGLTSATVPDNPACFQAFLHYRDGSLH